MVDMVILNEALYIVGIAFGGDVPELHIHADKLLAPAGIKLVAIPFVLVMEANENPSFFWLCWLSKSSVHVAEL
jgi:hypothetical protein